MLLISLVAGNIGCRKKLHGYDVLLAAVDVRASLTGELRDGRLSEFNLGNMVWESWRTLFVLPRVLAFPAAGKQLERDQTFAPLATSTLRDIAPGIYKPTGCEIYASMPTDSRETESSSMRRDATT